MEIFDSTFIGSWSNTYPISEDLTETLVLAFSEQKNPKTQRLFLSRSQKPRRKDVQGCYDMKRTRTGTKFEKQRVSHTRTPKELIHADAIFAMCEIDPLLETNLKFYRTSDNHIRYI
jgi:hypothetical protein